MVQLTSTHTELLYGETNYICPCSHAVNSKKKKDNPALKSLLL